MDRLRRVRCGSCRRSLMFVNELLRDAAASAISGTINFPRSLPDPL